MPYYLNSLSKLSREYKIIQYIINSSTDNIKGCRLWNYCNFKREVNILYLKKDIKISSIHKNIKFLINNQLIHKIPLELKFFGQFNNLYVE